MSEPTGDRDWRPYVQDMVEFGERVATYVEGLDQQALSDQALG